MKIAVPLENDQLCEHFGHCQEFVILETHDETLSIVEINKHPNPPHEPYLLPRWLHRLGVNVIIAGGMGRKALQQFSQNGIKVVIGAPMKPAQELVKSYLNGTLESGANTCDH